MAEAMATTTNVTTSSVVTSTLACARSAPIAALSATTIPDTASPVASTSGAGDSLRTLAHRECPAQASPDPTRDEHRM